MKLIDPTNRKVQSLASLIVILIACFSAANAQTTAFTYQGKLADQGSPANGPYEMQFKLFDSATNGIQQPQQNPVTIQFTGAQAVAVTNGVFTVNLDFTVDAFPGADRFLEIGVRHPGDASFTVLTPRQQLTSTPYAVQTLNAAKLGGVDASQYVQTNDSRLSDARPASSLNFGTASLTGLLPFTHGGTGLSASGASGNFLKSNGTSWTSAPLSATDVPAGSGNYIRNGTSQQSANFNIDGSGTIGGALFANNLNANSTGNLVINGQSSSTIGTWLRLNNTTTGGHNWNLISTGSGNGEGAGKLLFNDQTGGGSTRMILDGGGLTVPGNLTVNGTLSATVNTSNFATLPHCKAIQTSQQLILGVFTKVRLDDTAFCSGVTFDNATNQLVIVTPGLYQVNAEIFFFSGGLNGFRFLKIFTSAGEAAFGEGATSNGAALLSGANAAALVRLNAGDVVFIEGANSPGGDDTAAFSGRSASLSINWVGP